MSETSLVVPSEITLRHRSDDWTEGQVRAETEQLRKAKAVLFLDKVQHEKTIKELEPKLEDLQLELANVVKAIDKAAASEIGDLKPSEEFADVKKALKALKINNIACTIELVSVSIENAEIVFKRSIGDKERSYNRYVLDGEDTMKFTVEMKELKGQWKDVTEQIREVERKLLAARTALRDRANRMSDVEGAIALKNLNEDERVEVKELYTQLATGLNAHKLLDGKKD
jgi:hypothetical protein